MFTYISREHGFLGLYKGMEAKLLQTVMTAALMFLAYEKISAFIFAMSRKMVKQWIICLFLILALDWKGYKWHKIVNSISETMYENELFK